MRVWRVGVWPVGMRPVGVWRVEVSAALHIQGSFTITNPSTRAQLVLVLASVLACVCPGVINLHLLLSTAIGLIGAEIALDDIMRATSFSLLCI